MTESQTPILSAQLSAILDMLLEMRYVGDVDITRDGKRVAFGVWEVVPGEKQRRGRIWVADVESGEARPLTDGALVLSAQPGDTFKVVAVTASGRLEETVHILKGGVAEPAALAVPVRGGKGTPGAKGPGTPQLKKTW